MIRSILIICLLLIFFRTNAITVSGYIKDGNTGEKLIGATIFSNLNSTLSNNYGFFSLSLPSGKHNLTFSFVGYKSLKREVTLKKDTTLFIELYTNNEIAEVQVKGENPYKIQSHREHGMKTIPLKLTGSLPVFMGERDIMKTLQLMPGVHPGSEGSTGLFVRGAEGSHNMILIDGVQVFNPNHLLGFFSIFNEDAINNVKFYTSGFPAKYNGRLASVTDIRMKDGNENNFSANGSIGLISSKFLIEGPLLNSKITYMLTGRRTYLDLFAKPLVKKFTDDYNADYYFYDLNGKVKWQVNSNTALHISAYSGEDKGGLGNSYVYGSSPPVKGAGYNRNIEQEDFHWGNSLLIARYEQVVNEKLFVNISASSSNYNYRGEKNNIDSMMYWNRSVLVVHENTYGLTTKSKINENTLALNAEYFHGENHTISFGGDIKNYFLAPKVLNNNVSEDTSILSSETSSNILSFYLQDEIKISEKFKIIPGINVNHLIKTQNRIYFDKRIALNYKFNNTLSTSISYSETTQYLHKLSLSRISLASDLWLISDEEIEPSGARDISLSCAYSLLKGWNISTSLYYRKYNKLLLYKEGASFQTNVTSYEDLITCGSGNGKGFELLIEKSTGRIKGFVSYSLSSAYRKFPEINEGKKFRATFNRPHVLYIASSADINKRWRFGLVFNVMSGAMQTYSHARYISWFDVGESLTDDVYHAPHSGFDILVYDRNAYRMPVYHRLDVSFTYSFQALAGEHSINFGLFNAYNAKNAYATNQVYTSLGYAGNPPVEHSFYRLEKKVLFPIVPFINYSFKY